MAEIMVQTLLHPLIVCGHLSGKLLAMLGHLSGNLLAMLGHLSGNLLAMRGHLSRKLLVVLPKLSRKGKIGVDRSRRARGGSRDMNSREDRLRLRSRRTSLARILLRRVLLMSTDCSIDRSEERSKFNCFKRRVMSIPKGKCRFGTRR